LGVALCKVSFSLREWVIKNLVYFISVLYFPVLSESTGDCIMPSKLATTTTKTFNRRQSEQVFTAIYENGVLKPLTEIRGLPARKKFVVIVRSNGKSIASQMYGLFRPQNQAQLDAIIESEDWL
jgi:predicted DNA-binding antitoxin AbrB/MazE fold protein